MRDVVRENALTLLMPLHLGAQRGQHGKICDRHWLGSPPVVGSSSGQNLPRLWLTDSKERQDRFSEPRLRDRGKLLKMRVQEVFWARGIHELIICGRQVLPAKINGQCTLQAALAHPANLAYEGGVV